MEKRNDCFTCAYKLNISGDCHVQCMFNWRKADIKSPKASLFGIQSGYYLFPVNFDPIWQEEQCRGYSTEVNEELYKDGLDNPFADVLHTLLRMR